MSNFKVELVKASKGPNGIPLITFAVCYERMIHADVMTHREFSRNASGSRAIPFNRMIKWIENDVAQPIYWGSAAKGMQSGDEVSDVAACQQEWMLAWSDAKHHANILINLYDTHKEWANRLIEPFGWINVLISSNYFDNFFALRIHPDATPALQRLASTMARYVRKINDEDLYEKLEVSQWHLPYITDHEKNTELAGDLVMMSTARCARVSYKTFEDKVPTFAEDMTLYERLINRNPKHVTPSEHVAIAYNKYDFSRSGNFLGWGQYRKLILGEYIRKFDYSVLDREYKDKDFILPNNAPNYSNILKEE